MRYVCIFAGSDKEDAYQGAAESFGNPPEKASTVPVPAHPDLPRMRSHDGAVICIGTPTRMLYQDVSPSCYPSVWLLTCLRNSLLMVSVNAHVRRFTYNERFVKIHTGPRTLKKSSKARLKHSSIASHQLLKFYEILIEL